MSPAAAAAGVLTTLAAGSIGGCGLGTAVVLYKVPTDNVLYHGLASCFHLSTVLQCALDIARQLFDCTY